MVDTLAIETKARILADLWTEYRDDENFTEFIEYNDLGLPLAYALTNSIIESTPMVEQFVNEAFRLLVAGLEIEEAEYQNLSDMLDASKVE
jgi:hypothetical protein